MVKKYLFEKVSDLNAEYRVSVCWMNDFFPVSLSAIDCHCDSVTIIIRQWSQLLHMKWTIVRHCKYVGWVLGTHIGAKEGGYLNFVVNRDIIALYDFIHTGWKLLHMYRKYTVNFKILFQTFSDWSYRLCMQSAKLIRYAYEYCRYITNTTGIFRDCHDCVCAMCIQCNVSVYFNIHWIMQV